MNSQPGKLSVLPGRVKTGGVTPVVYDEPTLRACKALKSPLSVAMQCPGSIHRNDFTPFCKAVSLAEWKEARPV